MNFIISNGIEILVVVLFVSGCLLLYREGKKSLVKRMILALVVQAEKSLGSGTGELKYATVINASYSRLPWSLRLLFTPKDIDKYIEEGVIKLKELLSCGKDLLGYDDECMLISKFKEVDTLESTV